jgi:hypothetical protein
MGINGPLAATATILVRIITLWLRFFIVLHPTVSNLNLPAPAAETEKLKSLSPNYHRQAKWK